MGVGISLDEMNSEMFILNLAVLMLVSAGADFLNNAAYRGDLTASVNPNNHQNYNSWNYIMSLSTVTLP